ncbi:hypothetical protein ebrios_46A [Escherichia phage Ebrios]|uniref:Uncharacterized protein n=1 Tax=Escherichia phage Ebrios TaxID=2099356 RepID=A0A2S2HFK2_9CAUD|nr:hypothetical protein HOS96_gp51 [Escherichia phage Ebrios]AWL54351.1 hypothetical protein ebrios_46A [Escherichia phage Ebrios]
MATPPSSGLPCTRGAVKKTCTTHSVSHRCSERSTTRTLRPCLVHLPTLCASIGKT